MDRNIDKKIENYNSSLCQPLEDSWVEIRQEKTLMS